MRERIFSGAQPTGQLHIGNYIGAIKQWVELQDKYESIFCIVDYHAITVDYNSQTLRQKIINTAINYLACGIDPAKSIIFIQSDVPEHTELAWILNTLTPIGELSRMTQFKEKSEKFKNNVNTGLFTYPVLQAADILIYKAHSVPVGEDQVQHIELTRDIAKRFNQKFGNIFPEPQALITEGARILGLDGKGKMSKTGPSDSCIFLSDPPDEIRRKIGKATTDQGNEKEISEGTKNLLQLYKFFAGDQEFEEMLDQRRRGVIKYSVFKSMLAEVIIRYLHLFQEKIAQLSQNINIVKNILEEGAKKLRPLAQETIREVKEKMGVGIRNNE